MSVSLVVEVHTREALRALERLAEAQLPFATALALTRTAGHVKRAVVTNMRSVFDRPTPFTLNSVAMRPANKRDAPPYALVYLKEFATKGVPASKFLRAQILGGSRHAKKSERLLERRGFMQPSERWVPGPGARLNAYGNVPGGTITRILSALQANSDSAQNSKGAKRRRYFVPPRNGGLAPGVWERTGKRRVRPVLLFKEIRPYTPRLDLFEVARQEVARRWPTEAVRALQDAVRTAR